MILLPKRPNDCADAICCLTGAAPIRSCPSRIGDGSLANWKTDHTASGLVERLTGQLLRLLRMVAVSNPSHGRAVRIEYSENRSLISKTRGSVTDTGGVETRWEGSAEHSDLNNIVRLDGGLLLSFQANRSRIVRSFYSPKRESSTRQQQDGYEVDQVW